MNMKLIKFLLIFNETLETSLKDATDLTDYLDGIQDKILTVDLNFLKETLNHYNCLEF